MKSISFLKKRNSILDLFFSKHLVLVYYSTIIDNYHYNIIYKIKFNCEKAKWIVVTNSITLDKPKEFWLQDSRITIPVHPIKKQISLIICWIIPTVSFDFNNLTVLAIANNWRQLLIKESLLIEKFEFGLNIDKGSILLRLFNK